MAKTQAEFRDIVLGHLKVLAAGETTSAEDAATTNSVIETVHAELQEDGIAYWDLATIPDSVIGWLKRVVAADLAHDFVTLAEAQNYESKREPSKLKLRALTANVAPTLPNIADFF